MVAVAEFAIPASAFPFGRTLKRMPDVRIRIDEIVPTHQSALPFFWVRGCDPESFLAEAEHEPEVYDTRMLEEFGDLALFRAEWRPNAAIVEGLKRADVTIVELIGQEDKWTFEIRATDREDFRRFRALFEAQDVSVELHRLYDLQELLAEDSERLTERQRSTLLAAYEEGYFDNPRRTTQAELGEHFDIGRRAVSDRLQRGIRNLIEDTLVDETSATMQ